MSDMYVYMYVCMHVCTKSFLKTTTNSLCVCAHLANKADSDSDLEPPGLLLEQASRPNWAIWGEEPLSGRWPRARWSLWQSFSFSLWREENLPEEQPSLQHSTNQACMVVARRKPLLGKRHMTARLEFPKRHSGSNSLVWWNKDWTLWPEWQASCLEETRHRSSPGQYHLYSEA